MTDFQKLIDDNFPDGLNDNPEAYEAIFNLYQGKFELNSVTRDALEALLFLSDFQVNNFIKYREVYGPLHSIYELQAIYGFDYNSIQNLLLFCQLGGDPVYRTTSLQLRQQLILRHSRIVQDKEGFKKPDSVATRFLGDPNQYFVRYNCNIGRDIEGGFVLEKDPGEQLRFDLDEGKYLFDFSSFYFSVKNKNVLKKLVVGEYKFQTGQGLVFGPVFSFGIGTNPILNAPKGAKLHSNSSSYELKNFSGIGVTLGKDNVTTSLLLSSTHKGATVYHYDEDGSAYIRAFRSTGLHRNDTEIASRRTLSERHLGINVDYISKDARINVGANYSGIMLSLPIEPDPDLRNFHDFSGRKNVVFGSYINYMFRADTQFFSEFAKSNSGGYGIISGITHQAYSDHTLSLIFRNYQPEFHSLKGNAFSRKSSNNNERGIYLGIKLRPLKNLVVKSFIDSYASQWLDYRADRPLTGREWQVAFEYTQYRFFQFSVIRKSILKETNGKDNSRPFREIVEYSKQKTTINAEIQISSHLKWKSRLQWSRVAAHESKNRGFLMSTGVNYRNEKIGMGCAFHIFDADDYENRQHVYLHSLPYAYKYGGFQNKGSNFNCALNIRFNENILLSLNIVQTVYNKLYEIGSGVDKITGNRKTEIGSQVVFNF